jgi:N-methylhydantoinase B
MRAIMTDATNSKLIQRPTPKRPDGGKPKPSRTPGAGGETGVFLSGAYDVVTLNVLINAFHAVAEEMGINLLRSARSTIIREARDCSCALFDAEGRIIAEAEHIPVQMSSLSLPMRACLKKHSPIKAGEVFLTNDPFIGGQHLQDITIFTPIFVGKRLIGFAGSIAHHVDIGGGAAGLTFDAKEFYEEGLRFTAMKLTLSRDFSANGVFYDLVHANFREPETTWGDIQAQLAANELGRRRILELADRYGADEVIRYMGAAMEYSERMMRTAISQVPDGVYEGTDQIDDGVFVDDPIPICVKITVSGSDMTVDFAGTSPQLGEFLNVPLGSTYSSTFSSIKMALTAGRETIPANDGCYRPITILAPYGSILNPAPPAAVRARMCGAYRLFDAILIALQKALGDRIPAPGFHANTTSGVSQFKGGNFSIFIEDIGGGWGGNPQNDGADMLDAPLSNCIITPIEAVELDHPFIMVRRYELLPDTGGAGTHRGGLGSVREYEVLEEGAEFFGYSDRHRFAPPGAAGGRSGSRGAFRVIRQGEEIILPSKTRFKLRKGDIVRVVVGGGGGFGEPSARPAAAVLEDLSEGKITEAHMRAFYPHAVAPKPKSRRTRGASA